MNGLEQGFVCLLSIITPFILATYCSILPCNLLQEKTQDSISFRRPQSIQHD